jgi:hypothetical protein
MGLLQRLILGNVAGRIEKEGQSLQSGQGGQMTAQVKAWLEGAGWAFGAAAIGGIASALQSGVVNKAAFLSAIGAGLVALAAYVRKNPDI